MTVTTEDGGRQNMFAREPQMYIDPQIEEQQMNDNFETHNEKAEKLNGRFAMMGIIAALGSYAVTGQIIPGLWWMTEAIWTLTSVVFLVLLSYSVEKVVPTL